MHGYLDMWVVYDHPQDFPDVFVARRHEVRAPDLGGTTATGEIICSTRLNDIRVDLQNRGLVKLMRHEQDDPVVVEVWL